MGSVRITPYSPPDLDLSHKVALGAVDNALFTGKFGYNASVDAAEDIWLSGGAYTGFPAAGGTVEVVSAAAGDDAAGTAAQSITVQGLDGNGDPAEETLDLVGGGTAVTTGEFLRVNRAYVATAGTYGTNIGVVTIQQAGGSTFATIGADVGQSLVACYTIPLNHTGLIVAWRARLGRANGVAGSATIALQTKTPSGAWRSREYLAVTTAAPVEEPLAIALPELTDIRVRAIAVSNAGSYISAGFDVYQFAWE